MFHFFFLIKQFNNSSNSLEEFFLHAISIVLGTEEAC
jgi:hypothetical protein